jgi:hypothetical protein
MSKGSRLIPHLGAPARLSTEQLAALGHNWNNIREGAAPAGFSGHQLLMPVAAAGATHLAADVGPHAFTGVTDCRPESLHKPVAATAAKGL